MSEKLYKVKGSFTLLFALDDAMKPGVYETHVVLEDLVRIALSDGHMRVKDVKVTTIEPDKPTVVAEKRKEDKK